MESNGKKGTELDACTTGEVVAQRPQVDLSRYVNEFGVRNKAARMLWAMVHLLLFRLSPRPFFGWRRFLLRCFGAQVGRGVRTHSSLKVWAPWNLNVGDYSWLGEHVDCYNVDRVTIGAHAVVSQYAYLCTASHDISDPRMRLETAPIILCDNAWVCAGAYVGMGVVMGVGAVAAARAVIVKDVEPWTVVGGNPARLIKSRRLKGNSGQQGVKEKVWL